MSRTARSFAAAAVLLTACTSTPPASAPSAAAMPGSQRIPVTHAYTAALAAGTRAPDGRPGPRYWQQRVRYGIRAELDPRATRLRGRERIVYLNQSPDTLGTALLNLYQNIFTPGVPRNRFAPTTSGITLERVAVGDAVLLDRTRTASGYPDSAGYAVRGTLGRITLPAVIAPGDSAVFEVDWHYDIPPRGAFRTAWEDALGSRVLQVAQWYPQIAVYDDVNGWDETPYLGDGEFYLEYGDFDVTLTLPAGWTVGATGELVNPEQVLSAQTRARLDSAMHSDSTRAIVTLADLDAGTALQRGSTGKLTWRFHAEDVRDFAFAASDRYLWDATRADIPLGSRVMHTVLVHALYRPGAPGWEQAARYGQHALDFLSSRVMGYAYPQITVSEGPIYGMEYPMLVFIARPEDAADLQSVIAHEVGHEWFPMMVGQNEAAYAWMDEGVTTYQEDLARADFFPGTDPAAETRAAYLRVAGKDVEVPLMRHTDLVNPYGARTVAAYSKPAVVLRSLRGVVGDSVFGRAMRTYAQEWRFKHPQPWDFFDTFERVAGQDLDWFWQPWWFSTATFDVAITDVQPIRGGVRVTVQNRGNVVMPVRIDVTSTDGTQTSLDLSRNAWPAGARSVTVEVPAIGTPVRVEIDPEQIFPDVNRADNVWTADR